MKWIKKIFKKPDLKPFNYGAIDCPRLPVGSKLYAILDNDALDFIAGSCGMNMQIKKGKITKWKVIEIMSDGDLLCENKPDRILLQYLKWSDGNLVTIPMNLLGSRKLIRFY